jgi:predicted DNA-binding transcriptional regulator YafY
MAKQDYFLRYLLIIRKLRNNGTATFEEIREFLETERELRDLSGTISLRTFQRDLKEIATLFRVTIAFDYNRKAYYIEEDEGSDLNNRLVESLDTIHSLSMAHDMGSYMYFEKRKANGSQHLFGFLHAIKNHIVLELKHQKFDDDIPTVRAVAPYALKESRGRWYLVAKDMGDKRIKTFGLDRVLDFQNTPGRFDYPRDFDVNRHFRYCFGVINPDNAQPEEIILSFDPEQGKYIRSYPLHESQLVVIDNASELRIKLHLYVTYDLIQEVLSYGDRVRVIAPDELKTRVMEIAGTVAVPSPISGG